MRGTHTHTHTHTHTQGIRAVIAESYERIHRSNLVGMGIVPLQYLPGTTAESLGLTGRESYTIEVPEDIRPGQRLIVKVRKGGGGRREGVGVGLYARGKEGGGGDRPVCSGKEGGGGGRLVCSGEGGRVGVGLYAPMPLPHYYASIIRQGLHVVWGVGLACFSVEFQIVQLLVHVSSLLPSLRPSSALPPSLHPPLPLSPPP